jgi:hypothetical protein
VSPSGAGAVALLRHAVATVAYRGGKAVRGAPASFASFRAGEDTRTPVQILAHVGDLFDWALGLADGRHVWRDATPLPWDEEVARFFAALERFDARLARAEAQDASDPLGNSPEKIFQGPIADALTHIGQINMLRRIAAAPVKGENYFKADIAAGRVGADQSTPKVEFE